MIPNQGEIIEKEHSTLSILAKHSEGLVGVLFSIVWIAFLFIISYFEPYRQSFLLDSWFPIGLTIALIPAFANLVNNSLKLSLGSIQLIQLSQSISDVLTSIAVFLFYFIYPFDFGDLDPIISVIFLIVGFLSLISALSHLYKFMYWNPRDTKSLVSK